MEVVAREAKTHFTELLDRVVGGESVTITRDGRPVAQLVPILHVHRNPQQAAANIRQLRQGNRLDGDSIRDLIDEGRR